MEDPQHAQPTLFDTNADASNDPQIVRIVRLAARLARRHMAEYPHKFAPKKFTQPQLFACLIFKAHLGWKLQAPRHALFPGPDARARSM